MLKYKYCFILKSQQRFSLSSSNVLRMLASTPTMYKNTESTVCVFLVRKWQLAVNEIPVN
jgi:hypothetical protein